MKLFDSHAHYNDHRYGEEYPGGMEGAIKDAFDAGVCGFVCVGTEPDNCRRAIEIAEKYEKGFAAVGLHPEDANMFPREKISDIVDDIASLLSHSKVVALGEIGLDYHWDTPKDLQKEVFEMQLCIAEEKKIPVIIHDREAHGDTLEILKEYKPKGVVHCFSGSPEMAAEILKIGMYIGVGGVVTFKNAKRLPETVALIPDDRLLTETDAPYLSPVPYRGETNHSGYITLTAAKIAEIRGKSAEEILHLATKNAKTLFGID